MPTITPFITFQTQAEEAAKRYCSIFEGSRILQTRRYGAGTPMPEGSVMTVELELLGQRYVFLNGGEHFQLTEAFSIAVECATQAEIDHYWARLTADGGKEGPCGWLTDRFGLSWQVNPAGIENLLSSPAAFQALMTMKKIDLAALRAAGGKS